MVRIGKPKGGSLATLADALVALPVTLALDEESADALHALLQSVLKKT